MASLLRDTFDARQVAGDSSTNNKPWHCQACLFMNKGDRNTCAVCKRKRQKGKDKMYTKDIKYLHSNTVSAVVV